MSCLSELLSTQWLKRLLMRRKLYTKETERFIHTFDKFHDLMNVRGLKEGIHKCKPNLHPYRNDSQSRDHLKASITYFSGVSYNFHM